MTLSLLELEERLVALTEPNARLDVELERFLLGCKGRNWTYELIREDGIEYGTAIDGHISWMALQKVRPFTSCLNAAVAFAAEALNCRTGWGVHGEPSAWVVVSVQGKVIEVAVETAPNPPMCLVHAVLRALILQIPSASS